MYIELPRILYQTLPSRTIETSLSTSTHTPTLVQPSTFLCCCCVGRKSKQTMQSHSSKQNHSHPCMHVCVWVKSICMSECVCVRVYFSDLKSEILEKSIFGFVCSHCILAHKQWRVDIVCTLHSIHSTNCNKSLSVGYDFAMCIFILFNAYHMALEKKWNGKEMKRKANEKSSNSIAAIRFDHEILSEIELWRWWWWWCWRWFHLKCPWRWRILIVDSMNCVPCHATCQMDVMHTSFSIGYKFAHKHTIIMRITFEL